MNIYVSKTEKKAVKTFMTKARAKKIMAPVKTKSIDEIGIDLFQLYCQRFGVYRLGYNDAVEVEAIKLSEETELFIKSMFRKIGKIAEDKTSKVRVYSDLLKVGVNASNVETFFKAKEELRIYG